MNRYDYLTDAIVSRMASLREKASAKEDSITRGRDQYTEYLVERGLDINTDDEYADARNEYLASCLAVDAELSAEMFRDKEELKDINLKYYLGKHDRVQAVVSREYEDEEGDTIYNHLLVEHTHDNPHLEGVRRLATAYANVTYVEQGE